MDMIMIGTIMLFAFDFAPIDWALCDGSLLNSSDHPGLFALIKSTYGGNGYNNYMLPNLLGTEPIPGMRYYIAVEGIMPPMGNS